MLPFVGTTDSLVNLSASFKAPEDPYSIVLPIREECMDKGRHIIVRTAKQNAQAKQARFDTHVAGEALRREKEVEEVDARDVASSIAVPFTPIQPPRTRKRMAATVLPNMIYHDCRFFRMCISRFFSDLYIRPGRSGRAQPFP
jgi:hypothetical protein